VHLDKFRGVIASVICSGQWHLSFEKMVKILDFIINFRSISLNTMEKRVLRKDLIFIALIGFMIAGCSDVTRVSVSVPPELMQVRMEVVSLLSEAHDIEETGATVGKGILLQLKEAAPKISNNTADVDKFKSYLSELEDVKKNDVQEIKSLTGKMVACIEIPEPFQTSFVRENKKNN
jgi:hypothetical protein